MDSDGHSFGSPSENEDEMENRLIGLSSQLELLKQKVTSDGVKEPSPAVLKAKIGLEENVESRLEKAFETVEMQELSLERQCKCLTDELESERRMSSALWASYTKELEKTRQENEKLSSIVVNKEECIEKLKAQLLETQETGKKERDELYNRTVVYEKKEKELCLRISELERETLSQHDLKKSVNQLTMAKEIILKELNDVKKELKEKMEVLSICSDDVVQFNNMNNELKRELAATGTVISKEPVTENKSSMISYLSYLNKLFDKDLDDLLSIENDRECEFCHKHLVDVIEMDRSNCFCCSLLLQMIHHKEKIKRLEENNRKERQDYHVAGEYRRKQSIRIRDCIIFILVLVTAILMYD